MDHTHKNHLDRYCHYYPCRLKGYKIAKKKFAQDLETDIIYNIIILRGGNSKKAKIMLYKKSP